MITSSLHHHYIIGNRCQPTEEAEAVGGVDEREKLLPGVNSLASGFNLKVLMVSLWNRTIILSLSLSHTHTHFVSRPTLSPWFPLKVLQFHPPSSQVVVSRHRSLSLVPLLRASLQLISHLYLSAKIDGHTFNITPASTRIQTCSVADSSDVPLVAAS